MKKNKKIDLLFLIILFLLSGCNLNQGENTPEVNKTVNFTSTEKLPTIETTPTHEINKTVLPSPTNSKTPTLVLTQTPTLTPIPTFTLIPIQTLTTNQLLTVMNILDGTPSCSIPCWNGITPGQTDKDEMIDFLTRLGYEDTNLIREDIQKMDGGINIQLRPDYTGGTLEDPIHWITVVWNNYLVDKLELDAWDHPEQYTIEKFEEVLGVPNEIKIVHGPGDRYVVIVNYEKFHAVFKIFGNMKQRLPNNEPLPFCVNIQDHSDQVVNVILYSEEIKYEVMKPFEEEQWLNWAGVLDISTKELFGRLKTTECIPHP